MRAIAWLATSCSIVWGPAASSLLAAETSGQSPTASTHQERSDLNDWANWRGPYQNSTSRATGLIDAWDPSGGEGSDLLWKRTDLGTRSTPIVFRGKLYVLVRDQPGSENEGEKVVCVDASTGKTVWEYRFNVYLSDVPDTRVAWSSVVADAETGRIYAQGVCGYFCCLEGETGKLVWDRSLSEELGVITTFGGRTNVPVVFEDAVLISAVVVGWGDTPEFGGLARPAHRFMAFDKATGELRWLQGTNISPPDTTYSTPTIAMVGGEAQLIFGSSDGQVWGFRPRTGEPLWHYPLSRRGLNTSPLVVGDRVYMSQSEENIIGATQGAVVALDATLRGDLTDKHLWLTYQIMSGKSSPLMIENHIWTIDDRAKLHILNAETGREVAKKALGTAMRSTPVLADGKVYLCTSGGRWFILKPTMTSRRAGADVVHRLRLDQDASDGSPIVGQGRIYLPTSEAIYCLGVESTSNDAPEASGAALDALPEADSADEEKPIGDDVSPSVVQVVPYDVLLKPGQMQQFKARLYNARGQFLRVARADEVQWRVSGPGTVATSGQYRAPTEGVHTASLVTCQVGASNGKARIRIVPPLPWSWDFDNDDNLPITWVGGRVRYVLREQDGERVAVKRDVLPTPSNPVNKLGTRSQAFMGPVDLANYTIQADVQITEKQGRRPDVGVINSGYTLILRPENDEIRANSWTSHVYRTSASKKFAPEIGVWYRLKLRVEQQGEQALIQGKVWPRDESEPDQWTLEMTDRTPQRNGSPGLYGKSEQTELYVDNVSVTPNE